MHDGGVWTSAGVTAGMDLALALVADDLGPELAHDVAQWLVVFVRRPGGQSQFSAQLAAGPARSEPISRSCSAGSVDHLGEDLSVPALAARADDEPPALRRAASRAEMRETPAAFVEDLRVEGARRLFATTGRIGRRCRRIGRLSAKP